MAKFKNNKKETHNINERIYSKEVRLVDVEKYGKENGIYNKYEALRIAEELELDLIEISSKSDPVVCKIEEYSKFLYDKKKKEKEQNKNQVKTTLKEIRFTPNTDDNDFQVKLKKIKEFLTKKNKVKVWVFFKGREIMFKNKGEILLLKLLQEVSDLGKPEKMPKLEGRKMVIIINPK